jgi:penicillin-binding protein 2
VPPKRIAIKDHTAEANLFARRTVISLLFILMMLVMLISNLYYLQVERHEDYQTRSNGNRIKILPVAPNRGLIYDRNGVLLAENRPVYSLEVIPEQVDNLEQTLGLLGVLLDIDEDEITDFYREIKRHRRFKPVALRKHLSPQEVALFSVNQYKFPGVTVEARLTRHYPYNKTLTHVLGYVARINKKDLQKLTEAGLEANYAATHDIGKLGVEKYHEHLLHGQVGYQEVEVNNQGRIIRTLNFNPPVPGQDLVLNIDIRLQLEAQKIMDSDKGTIVMLDSQNGGVLALFSSPSYDPNLFVDGISSKNYNRLLNAKDRPLINRATQGQYPPASTVKPLLALAGLEEKVITTETRIFDNGKYKLKNVEHIWRDWKTWGHGWMDVTSSIEQSCDIFFYDLAFRLGIDKISEHMHEFGFGDYTGIDLHEESDANMPSRGWKRARYNEPWYIGDTIPVGIGQSYWTATPIQLTQSISTLVNHGKRFIPQLLRGRLTENNLQREGRKERRPIDIVNDKNWDIVLDAMYGVVNREKGTARKAFIDTPYVSAGKSGTAQLVAIAQDAKYDVDSLAENLRDNAMYVAFAPFEDPEVTITVVLENAGGGSSQAAPLARKMMDKYFANKPLAPVDDTVQQQAVATNQSPDTHP